jgi:hypothetical protein
MLSGTVTRLLIADERESAGVRIPRMITKGAYWTKGSERAGESARPAPSPARPRILYRDPSSFGTTDHNSQRLPFHRDGRLLALSRPMPCPGLGTPLRTLFGRATRSHVAHAEQDSRSPASETNRYLVSISPTSVSYCTSTVLHIAKRIIKASGSSTE